MFGEEQSTAGFEDAPYLGQRGGRIPDRAKRKGERCRIDALAVEGQGFARAAKQLDGCGHIMSPLTGEPQQPGRRIDTINVFDT